MRRADAGSIGAVIEVAMKLGHDGLTFEGDESEAEQFAKNCTVVDVQGDVRGQIVKAGAAGLRVAAKG